MKIAMLGNAANAHTHRWCAWAARTGHEVAVFTDSDPRAGCDWSGCSIVRPKWTLLRNLVTFKLRGGPYANNRDKWRAYAEDLRAFAPDLLHAHEALAYGPMAARFPQHPVVLTPWGPDVECLSGADEERRSLTLSSFRAAAAVSTNGPGLDEAWSALTGVPRTRFHLFSWGVDTAVFHPRPRDEQLAVLARLGIPADRPFLLSPRVAKEYYGVETIRSAWRAANVDGGARMLLVVLRAGAPDGEWRPEHAGLRDGGEFGVDAYLAPAEMAALYSAARGVVMIPRTDLLAMSLLEACACGTVPILNALPVYLANVDELSSARGRLRGMFAGSSPDGMDTAGVLAATMRAWGAMPDERLREVGAGNAAAVARDHDWSRNAGLMAGVYEAALKTHAESRR